ncbi:microrchidia 6-like protein isoform X1 [Tanacetum coccineum]
MTFIFKSLQPTSEEHANSNLSVLLQWSPFSTEEELLKQVSIPNSLGREPFLSVVGLGKGRGIVGVLEANYIEPTHNKQDFENTNVYQKLVTRLRVMTYEYWDMRCRAIGCEVSKKAWPLSASPCSSRSPQIPVGCSKSAPDVTAANNMAALNGHSKAIKPVELVPCLPRGSNDGSDLKRKLPDHPKDRTSKNIRVSPDVANMGSNMVL